MQNEVGSDGWAEAPSHGSSSSLEFRNLCQILDPSEAKALFWHSTIDRKARTVTFFQVQCPSTKPRIPRCIRLTKERTVWHREVLEASVFLNEKQQPASFVRSILGKSYVDSVEGLTELLKAVETSEIPAGSKVIIRSRAEEVNARLEASRTAEKLNAILNKAKYPPSSPPASQPLADADKRNFQHKTGSRRRRELACAQQVDDPEVPPQVGPLISQAPAQVKVSPLRDGTSEKHAPADEAARAGPDIITIDASDDDEGVPPRKKTAQRPGNARGNFLDNLITRCLDNDPPVRPGPTLVYIIPKNAPKPVRALPISDSTQQKLPTLLPKRNANPPSGAFDGLGVPAQANVYIPLVVPPSAGQPIGLRTDKVTNVTSFVLPSPRTPSTFPKVPADVSPGGSNTTETPSRLNGTLEGATMSSSATGSTEANPSRLDQLRSIPPPAEHLPRSTLSTASSFRLDQTLDSLTPSFLVQNEPKTSKVPVGTSMSVSAKDIVAQIPSVPKVSDSDWGVVDLMEKYYWVTPGPGQVLLVTGSHIYIYASTLVELKHQYGPPKERKVNKYVDHLVQHLVGGWDNVLKYRKRHVGVLCIMGAKFIDSIIKHVEDVFKTGIHKPRLLKYLNQRMKLYEQRKKAKKAKLKAKRAKKPNETPSEKLVDAVENEEDEHQLGQETEIAEDKQDVDVAKRRRFLENCYWTTPGDGKVQLCPGYDVYVYQQSLKDFSDLYGPTQVRRDKHYGLRWSKYAECLLVHLSGGWDNVINDTRPCAGSRSLLGSDVHHAVSGHIKELFGNEGDIEHFAKKVGKAWFASVSQGKKQSSSRHGRKNTKKAASDQPAAEPTENFSVYLDTCYWKTRGEDKVPLHPGFEIYIYPAILDELKNQYGPGTPHPGPHVWSRYAIYLFVHLVGGWDNLMKYKRHGAGVGRMMDDDFFYAMLGHMRELFKIKMTKRELVTKLDQSLQEYRQHRYNPTPTPKAENYPESGTDSELEDSPDLERDIRKVQKITPPRSKLTTVSQKTSSTLREGRAVVPKIIKQARRSRGERGEGWDKYYWATWAEGRVPLCPNYGIFIDQRVLEEIVQQFGPKQHAMTQWSKYACRLVDHLVGGWKTYVRDRPAVTIIIDKVLGEDFSDAVIEHVEQVFEVEIDKGQFMARMNSKLYRLRNKLRKQSTDDPSIFPI
ncbi:hypothetical protein RvY_06952 [Ramazzottius varieornatus]|uniref:Uncharacterized protein n=1 Tax=Ramazzottius varieornatus TaxID=947166 RepID=A0A1D1V0C3_RAMVA|nr:hypothetical protein RvY_06952 [Ramazzottius varieornatus]